MKVKINKRIYDYLFDNLSTEKSSLIEQIKINLMDDEVLIELDESIACDIRDWAGEKLQKVGFDKDYNLTKQGEYLEEIIDLLYV